MKTIGWLLAILVCTSSLLFSECVHYLDTPDNEPVKLMLENFAQAIKREKNLIPRSKIISVDCECKIEKIGLYFDSYEHPDIPTARYLILGITEGLLNYINADERIRPLLALYPFPIENVEIRINFIPKDCDYTFPRLGNIAIVSISDGVISYETLNSFNFRIEHLRAEDYFQAQLLNQLY